MQRVPLSTHAYTPKNGQVFTETVSSPPRSMTARWKRHCTGRSTDPQKYKHDKVGAASLRDMALRSCCWNKHLFLPEALTVAEWPYAGMVWQRLVET